MNPTRVRVRRVPGRAPSRLGQLAQAPLGAPRDQLIGLAIASLGAAFVANPAKQEQTLAFGMGAISLLSNRDLSPGLFYGGVATSLGYAAMVGLKGRRRPKRPWFPIPAGSQPIPYGLRR